MTPEAIKELAELDKREAELMDEYRRIEKVVSYAESRRYLRQRNAKIDRVYRKRDEIKASGLSTKEQRKVMKLHPTRYGETSRVFGATFREHYTEFNGKTYKVERDNLYALRGSPTYTRVRPVTP